MQRQSRLWSRFATPKPTAAQYALPGTLARVAQPVGSAHNDRRMPERCDVSVRIDRRRVLQGGASAALLLATHPAAASIQQPARPTPLSAVRLLPSPYLNAVNVNLRYLHSLDPDRLLHNFHSQAGLIPKGALYAGWESDTIGGHTLGHYLSALSLMHAQTGDAECKRRVAYIVHELSVCQAQSADGFVAGFTRRRSRRVPRP